jgi:hypothetical protein
VITGRKPVKLVFFIILYISLYAVNILLTPKGFHGPKQQKQNKLKTSAKSISSPETSIGASKDLPQEKKSTLVPGLSWCLKTKHQAPFSGYEFAP